MYATNIVNLVKLMLKDGALKINLEDEIIRETLVTHEGKLVNPRVAQLIPQEVATS
jgi:NAD(P) transhydrogenase subunit alpha